MGKQKRRELFSELTLQYNLYDDLLSAVLIIEQTARPIYARTVEYVLLVISFICNKVFSRQIKNYTIGKCQLGLVTILNYYGAGLYIHLKFIPSLSLSQLFTIYHVAFSDLQYRVLANHLSKLCLKAKTIYPNQLIDQENALCYVGEEFNGKFSYGLRLADLVNNKTL